MKKILIVGKNSYIGDSFASYCKDDFAIDIVDSFNDKWKDADFTVYDTVFHVAGIAHQKIKKTMGPLYLSVNRDLAIDVAKHAKEKGVKHFIFMSSMSIYGGDKPIGKEKIIKTGEEYAPDNIYGQSKLEADLAIQKMTDDNFKAAIIRAPIIYGPNSKGNFQRLIKLSKLCLILPKIHNKRSMIYIDNLSKFISTIVFEKKFGVFYPQNNEYMDTNSIIKEIRALNNKKTKELSILNPFVKLASRFINEFNKLFSSYYYSKDLTGIDNYAIKGRAETIRSTVGK